MSETLSWKTPRNPALDKPLKDLELGDLSHRAFAVLTAKTLGDVTKVTDLAFYDALAKCGATSQAAGIAKADLGELMARDGLRFARQQPVEVSLRSDRPARSLLRAGLIEHVAEDLHCRVYRLEQAPRKEHWPRPNGWSWEIGEHLLSFGVTPLKTADVETLVSNAREVHATIEEGPWGALVNADAVITRWNKEHEHEVSLFDAQLGVRAIARVQAYGANAGEIPDQLVALTSELACSLWPRRS